MRRPRPLPVLAALACAFALPGLAQAAGLAQKVAVTSAWSRPVAAGLATGVAYATLHNPGPSADRLLGAATPVAARVSLHRSMDMNGMATMAPVAGGLVLPTGQAVSLAPGGYHLMLEGVKRGLKAGDRYPLTLRFAHAPSVTVQVAVRADPPPES